MTHLLRRSLVCLVAYLSFASMHCSGGATGPTSELDDGGVALDGAPKGSSSGGDGSACTAVTSVPAVHRATATACPGSQVDGGPTEACRLDQDCGAAHVCLCASQIGGNSLHVNVCATAQCQVDADCGPGGYCSPSDGGYCGTATGYFCHTASDCCRSDADCVGAGGRCGYDATSARWQCAAIQICAG